MCSGALRGARGAAAGQAAGAHGPRRVFSPTLNSCRWRPAGRASMMIGGVSAPLSGPATRPPACPARPKPALGAAGPPCGGWRIGRRGEAGNGLALTVAVGATTQALKHASSAPMSSVLGWAHLRIYAVGKSWRSPISRSAVETVISALRTHQARLGNAHGRARARCSRCSAGNVVMWEPRAAWWRAGRARARGSTRHRWQAPRGSKCARVRRRGQRAGASPAAACKPFASRRPCCTCGFDGAAWQKRRVGRPCPFLENFG